MCPVLKDERPEIISYLKKTISMNEKDQEKQTEKLTLAEN